MINNGTTNGGCTSFYLLVLLKSVKVSEKVGVFVTALRYELVSFVEESVSVFEVADVIFFCQA